MEKLGSPLAPGTETGVGEKKYAKGKRMQLHHAGRRQEGHRDETDFSNKKGNGGTDGKKNVLGRHSGP